MGHRRTIITIEVREPYMFSSKNEYLRNNPPPSYASTGIVAQGFAVGIKSAAGVFAEVNSAASMGRKIIVVNGFYQAEGSAFRFNEYYYNKLWSTGRGAPFLIAEDVLKTAKTITVDSKPGFNRYVNDMFVMVCNPTIKEVWHLQPLPK